MPRKFMFTKEEVIEAALGLTREKGFLALTARALGEKLGSSSKPVFSHFENMKEVQKAVIEAAYRHYRAFLAAEVKKGEYPPYKASGIGYIRFAREERELFRLLFMRDRSQEEKEQNAPELEEILALLQKNLGLSREEAYLFHLEMWIYVHGIASMIATSYLDWDEDFVSRALTDAYTGMCCRYCGEGKQRSEKEKNFG